MFSNYFVIKNIIYVFHIVLYNLNLNMAFNPNWLLPINIITTFKNFVFYLFDVLFILLYYKYKNIKMKLEIITFLTSLISVKTNLLIFINVKV